MKNLMIVFCVVALGCGMQTKQTPVEPAPLSYVVDEMENGVFLFRADPASSWHKGNDTVAFTSRLNQFVQEHPELRIKTHNVLETQDVTMKTASSMFTFPIATKILVFTERRQLPAPPKENSK